MFPTSTQLKYWMFPDKEKIELLREEANERYVKENSAIYSAADPETENDEMLRDQFFLTVSEEAVIRRHYENILQDFCKRFEPPMPNYVVGTAMVYFKRIYLHNSVMDYHPEDFVYTCAYLACKVEEFNLSILQFVRNMDNPSERCVDLILSQELLLMQMLNYHLTVHNPYRPVEGLLIDIKTQCPEMTDPERMRPGIEHFLDKAILTDACFLFSPAQIALAAISASGKSFGLNTDSYVANKLCSASERGTITSVFDLVKKIRSLVGSVENVNVTEAEKLKKKLEICRNQENNPISDIYRQRSDELLDEEDDIQSQKRPRLDDLVDLDELSTELPD